LTTPPRTPLDPLSLGYIGLSLGGLGLLAVLTVNTTTSRITFPLHTPVTGVIFTGICLLGITLGVFPSHCARALHFRTRTEAVAATDSATSRGSTVPFRGHHPACSRFSAHVVHVGDATYCAGCMGLVAGAVISLVGCVSYFFLGVHVGAAAWYLFGLGVVGVVSGVLQYHLFQGRSGAAHFVVNVVFVVAAFLLLVGVNALRDNFALEAYLCALMVFWILTRMTLSQREHAKVCAACGVQSCGYR
jgi:hypothetical protein